ncbi:MAG: hypothetical protein WCF84_27115 [Anaerolineae bacterium]
MNQVLYTDLNVQECKKRLQAKTAPDKGFFSYLDPHPVRCKLYGNQFELRKNLAERNSWRVTMRGRFESENGGTLIQTQSGIESWVAPFMTCWLGGVLFFLAISSVFTIQGLLNGSIQPYIGVLGPIVGIGGMFLFGRAMQLYGRSSRQTDQEMFNKFLQETLDARILEKSRRAVAQ